MFFDGEKKTASVRTHHLKTARGIWRTNAVADGASGYVYETVSRCNHACADANARRAFRKDGVCALIATAPIAAGSEVLVDYGVGDRAPARATEQELVLCIVLQADGAGVPTPRKSGGTAAEIGWSRRPQAERRAWLCRTYGFPCACDACRADYQAFKAPPPVEGEQSDEDDM